MPRQQVAAATRPYALGRKPAARKKGVLSLQVPCGGGLLPFKRVFAFSPEVVHVGLEMQLEHVVLVEVFRLRGNGERVPKQRQAGEGVTVLEGGTEGGSSHRCGTCPQQLVWTEVQARMRRVGHR